MTQNQITPRLLSNGLSSKKYQSSHYAMETGEKYLTYLPHSGLHNQRIALINAMVLAKALNRTLIMPELNIGKANYWQASYRLAQKLDQCVDRSRVGANGLVYGCREYRRYFPVPVETMFDLTPAYHSRIRLMQRFDMSTDYFSRVWSAPDDHVYYVNDLTRFSYRIYDSNKNAMPMLNFEHRIDLEDLRSRPEPFLVFGSLFGSHRLALERPELRWLWNYLFREMGMSYPTVTEKALQVVAKLGGPDQFISVHLRQADGVFKATMAQTMDVVRGNLSVLASANPGVHWREEEKDQTLSPEMIQKLNELREARRYEDLLNTCQTIKAVKDSRSRIIFMATDATRPRESLQHLFEEFMCLFSLSDFPDVTENLTTTVTSNNTNSNETNLAIPSGSLLLPLIDAEIASHASIFVGTPKSTFSKYIQYRNDRFRSLYSR
ncbi:hypothetical protein EC973_005586 [Apophysomyces ossiformis]|uniref:O-fucosyltransferase family protein n=1 Tax=Apophysomyces ossiformis TaxID=679940 RepID=A0A8H7BW38_9FUNG|nr:hypothetical protein EC973_005586 [Apophysomyces ossiformis]